MNHHINFKIIATALFLCIFTTSFGFAKINGAMPENTIIISGSVVDKKTQEPIPYVNIGVLGAYMGTITNMEGEFELKIPIDVVAEKIQISAVGYEMIVLNIKEYAGKKDLVFELMPKDYSIGEVEIQAKSLFFIQAIKKAVRRIENNYLQSAFNYEAYYKSRIFENNELKRNREIAVLIYDKKGYKRGNAYRVYKQQAYKFLQVRRNFELNRLTDGSTQLDDLLEMDIVRRRGNVLDTNYLDLYTLELEKITEYDGDSVWVISYECNQPSLSNTGDYYAKSHKGKIYINRKDYAVVKNQTQVTASNYSPNGRSFYINPKKQKWKPLEIKYDFTVIYKKQKNHYYLSYINYNRFHKLSNKATAEVKHENTKIEMMVNKIKSTNPEVVRKRAYYENTPYNEAFWKNFNYFVDKEN